MRNRNSKGQFVKGHKHTREVLEKNREAHLGKRKSRETEFKKGDIPWNKDIKTDVKPWANKKFSEEHKEKLSKAKKQLYNNKENHPRWRGGITPEVMKIRNSDKYKQWRGLIFERDDYTCQQCSKRGVELNVHHIKSFAHYPKLRLKLNNGLTLCKKCHSFTDNYKGRAKKEIAWQIA